MNAGLMTAAGIAIHNFPEGMAVLFTSMHDLTIGHRWRGNRAAQHTGRDRRCDAGLLCNRGPEEGLPLFVLFGRDGADRRRFRVSNHPPFLTEPVLMGTLSAVRGSWSLSRLTSCFGFVSHARNTSQSWGS